MATVIDSLVVELGLDASKFTLQQREAFETAKRLEAQQLKAAKNVEYGLGKTTDSFRDLRNVALTTFAAVTGSRGIAEFAVNAVHAGAAVGRLSRNLNIPTSIISRWQDLATIFGGSAEGMASSFTVMTDAIQGWKIGDVKPIIADYRELGAAGGTLIDINRGVDQTFRDIAKNLRDIHAKDPAMGGYWQRRLGIDPGLYDAIISKQIDLNKELAKMEGLTQDAAEAAGALERRWLSFTTGATRGLQNFVLGMVESDSPFNPFGKNSGNQADIELIKKIGSWIQKAYMLPEGSMGGGGSASASATLPGGAFKSQAEKEAYIRAAFARRKINPNIAMAVAIAEGFNSFQSSVKNPRGPNGREDSWGAFQLYMGGGLGNEFQKKTGLDPRNPANERATIDFAADHVAKNGWGAFHGAKNTGISAWQGIDRNGGGNTSTTEVNIGSVIVQPKTDDPNSWATEFSNAVRNRAFAAQANAGQN
jgi:hypothetical protein